MSVGQVHTQDVHHIHRSYFSNDTKLTTSLEESEKKERGEKESGKMERSEKESKFLYYLTREKEKNIFSPLFL